MFEGFLGVSYLGTSVSKIWLRGSVQGSPPDLPLAIVLERELVRVWVLARPFLLRFVSSCTLDNIVKQEPRWHTNLRSRRKRARQRLHKSKGKPSALNLLAAKLLWDHHGSLPPRMSSTSWNCSFCKVQNGLKQLHCKSCYGRWQDVWDYQGARQKRQRSQSKKKHQKAGNKDQDRDPMKPFASLSSATPWKASTPEARVKQSTGLEDGDLPIPPSPMLPKPPLITAKTDDRDASLEAVRKALGGKMTKEIEEAVRSAEGQPSTPILTNSLMHRVANAQKAMQKARVNLEQLDGDWAEFRSTLSKRYEEQKGCYLAQRSEAMAAYIQKQEKFQELREELQKVTMAGKAKWDREPAHAEQIEDLELLDAEVSSIPEEEQMEAAAPNGDALKPFHTKRKGSQQDLQAINKSHKGDGKGENTT